MPTRRMCKEDDDDDNDKEEDCATDAATAAAVTAVAISGRHVSSTATAFDQTVAAEVAARRSGLQKPSLTPVFFMSSY